MDFKQTEISPLTQRSQCTKGRQFGRTQSVSSKGSDYSQGLDLPLCSRISLAGPSRYLCGDGEANYYHSVAAVDSTWCAPFICKNHLLGKQLLPQPSLWTHLVGAVVKIGTAQVTQSRGCVLHIFFHSLCGLSTVKPVSAPPMHMQKDETGCMELLLHFNGKCWDLQIKPFIENE